MSTRVAGVILAAAGVAALCAAVFWPPARFVGLAVAFVSFLLASMTVSRTRMILPRFGPLLRKTVRVNVWGAPLPGEGAFRVESVMSFGAGLLIYLRPAAGGSRTLLKVAQPSDATQRDDAVEVRDARYVSWGGRKLPSDPHAPAVVLQLAG